MRDYKDQNPASIASAAGRYVGWAVFLSCVAVGAIGAWHYAGLGLTLSHYDARGHLVVSRRVIDSLTPGWRQLGAVWLPLPHVLNLLPSQIDWAYRTGAIATAFSVVSMSAGLAAFAAFVTRHTGSVVAALVTPVVVLLNPNVLYLQSTPMTEPLLFGLALGAVATTGNWLAAPGTRTLRWTGWSLAALVLTRYEGWAIGATLVALAMMITLARREQAPMALLPFLVVPTLLFLLLGKVSTGAWFVASGFFVPDAATLHRPFVVLRDVWDSTIALGGWPLVIVGIAGAIVTVARATSGPVTVLPIALLSAAALPVAAFYQGHPHRVRYMVPLVVAAGALAAMAVAALPRRARLGAAAALCAGSIFARPPFDPQAPMVSEAQWERPFRVERRDVTRYLEYAHDGTPILASMGSLGHYMHETSEIGLGIADFLHEGNGDLWYAAMRSPRRYVQWLLIEERAEGGDALAVRAREDAAFLEGFSRVASGGGMALYRRRALQ